MGKKKKSKAYQAAVGGATGMIRILIYLCIVLVIVLAGREAYKFGYAIFNQVPMADEKNGQDVTVVIKEGQSVKEIGKVLKSKDLIDDANIFVVQELLSNYHGKLQPGTYILNTSQTADEMMAIMARENTAGQPQQDSSGTSESEEQKEDDK